MFRDGFRDYVHFTVNGRDVKLKGANAFSPLSDVLRYELGLTGTKVVCAEGDCGACTVMYARQSLARPHELHFRSINSCIATAILVDGGHLVTVEGLRQQDELCEIQSSMVRNFGGQCGFCTPGFVMSITNLYEQRAAEISEKHVKNYLTGNLCRCTGYAPIIQAALDVRRDQHLRLRERFADLTGQKEMIDDLRRPIRIAEGNREFVAPVNLKDACAYRALHPQSRLFSGATDLGVQINKGKNPGLHLVSLHLLDELYQIREEGGVIHVGARVNLDSLQRFLETKIPSFSEFLNIFASPQIKNMATLAGNLANASPIADTTPFLMTVDAEVELHGNAGVRSVPLTDFFHGYKKLNLRDDEVITQIRFRRPDPASKVGLFKVSQRRDLDIACVNSSFVVATQGPRITSAKVAYGGVGPTAVRLVRLEKTLVGQDISPALIDLAKRKIAEEIAPLSDVRGAKEYRMQVAGRLFEKFVRENWRL